MFMLTLTRQAIEPSLASLDADIATKAKCLFEYRGGIDHLSSAQAANKLMAVLKELDIQPFNPGQVARYKASQRRTKGYWAMWGSIVGTLVLSIGTVIWAIGSPLGPIFGPLASILGVVAIIVGIVQAVNGRLMGFGQWERSHIENYGLPIPTFALQTAIAIKEKMPEAELRVDRYVSMGELQERERRHRVAMRAADPFLVVMAGNYVAHIEVWEEPKFEQARKW